MGSTTILNRKKKFPPCIKSRGEVVPSSKVYKTKVPPPCKGCEGGGLRAWACSTIMLCHVVFTVLMATSPFAHPLSFWSSISTCFLPCKQSLMVAQVLGLPLGPCSSSTTYNPPWEQHSQQWGAQVILGIVVIPSPCHCCLCIPAHFAVVPVPIPVVVLLSWLSCHRRCYPTPSLSLSTCNPPCKQGIAEVCGGGTG